MKYCSNCNISVDNDVNFCPKCGAKLDNPDFNDSSYSLDPVVEKKTNGFAIAGFVLAFFSPLLGIIFSIIGLTKYKTTGSGKGLAIAGIILSIVFFILSLIISSFIEQYLVEILEQLGNNWEYLEEFIR